VGRASSAGVGGRAECAAVPMPRRRASTDARIGQERALGLTGSGGRQPAKALHWPGRRARGRRLQSPGGAGCRQRTPSRAPPRRMRADAGCRRRHCAVANELPRAGALALMPRRCVIGIRASRPSSHSGGSSQQAQGHALDCAHLAVISSPMRRRRGWRAAQHATRRSSGQGLAVES